MNNLHSLTQREIDVMVLVSQGKQNKVIAFDLGITENTVERHLQHIFAKFNVSCRTEAALIYLTDMKITGIRD